MTGHTGLALAPRNSISLRLAHLIPISIQESHSRRRLGTVHLPQQQLCLWNLTCEAGLSTKITYRDRAGQRNGTQQMCMPLPVLWPLYHTVSCGNSNVTRETSNV